jgi:hypothetical protein
LSTFLATEDFPMSAYFRKRFAKPAAARRAPVPTPAAPSGDVVDAVLRFCDVQEDVGGGRVLKRLSAARARAADVKAALGDAAGQAGRVSILWNTREDQIVRVLTASAAAQRLAA